MTTPFCLLQVEQMAGIEEEQVVLLVEDHQFVITSLLYVTVVKCV